VTYFPFLHFMDSFFLITHFMDSNHAHVNHLACLLCLRMSYVLMWIVINSLFVCPVFYASNKNFTFVYKLSYLANLHFSSFCIFYDTLCTDDTY
jgi:hypothetical protein